ncbi:hypothetical protein UFOVP251_38 [uncultured Caudovirales phage]|uniref:Terminase small subunit n=1 Tax=uncultured Caudovirales phage TaxID=2100421 RepID=A0A6J5LFP1_9CAUD|nr:hypothetical protein UFOVP251_38 [uncultured Caudovirales phage]
MKRPKSHDRRYKRSIWTQNQKLQAVSTYLMLGNMSETAIVTGIPLPTLKLWKQSDWFKDYSLQLQTEDVQQMSSNLKKVIDKALKAVEDRLDLGDAQFDQKTGDIIRIPVKAHVALKITTDLMTKQQKLYENPVKEQVEKTIDDRLLKLSEEFARFATAKKNTIDIEAIEVKQDVETQL